MTKSAGILVPAPQPRKDYGRGEALVPVVTSDPGDLSRLDPSLTLMTV